MKLFVSALVGFAMAVAATAVSAQEYQQPVAPSGAGQMSGSTLDDLQNGKADWEHALPAPLPRDMVSALSGTSQAGCPVTLTSARLNWPATYLPVTSAEVVAEPNLKLGFRNSSGRAIRSVTISATFLGKRSIYQLDAGAFDLSLTFSGGDAADKAADQLREIRVPQKMYAYGVTRVSLAQVLFADGTFWTPLGHGNCRLDVQGSAERIAK